MSQRHKGPLNRAPLPILPPGTALFIERQPDTDIVIPVVTGELIEGALYKGLAPGNTFTALEHNGSRRSTTLQDLGLSEILNSGLIDVDADRLYIWDAVLGEYVDFWFSNGELFDSAPGWRRGIEPADDVELVPGEGVIIQRNDGGAEVKWWIDGAH